MPESYFDADPATYDRAGPTYPDALFEDLWRYLDEGVRAHPEVVEMGPGTGQATRVLLERGANVTAVELGTNLASYLAEKHAGDPYLRVVNAAFEDAPLPEDAFDLVFAATAYHWVAPEARFARPHALLRDRGVLAVVDTVQVRDEADRGYFERSQHIYGRYWPEQATFRPAPEPSVEPPILDQMRGSGLFEDTRLWRYRWDQRYDVDAYLDLVRLYSNTAQLPPEKRTRFLDELREFVAAEDDGTVLRPLVITLVAGRRRSEQR